MKKQLLKNTLLMIFIFGFSMNSSSNPLNSPLSRERLKLLPIPMDFRNYFFFQSIDDNSYIIIGDFTGAKKLITQIIDRDSDNKIDKVLEYYPDSGKIRIKSRPSSEFFNGLEKMKRDIISGIIFKENYSYKMKSLKTLKFKLADGSDIYPYNDGYSVKFYDPDAPSTIMCEFFFSKRHGRYNLIFKTNYYKLYKLRIVPPLRYSVYCKNSRDPIVAEIVESLLKMIPK